MVIIRAALLFSILPSVLLLQDNVLGNVSITFAGNFTSGFTLKDSSTVTVPFTHDFSTGLHGWDLNVPHWSWTGNNNLPDTSDMSDFYHSGDIVWTQQHLTSFSSYMSFTLFKVQGVERSTRFTFKYYFSTDSSDSWTGLYIYLMDFSSSRSYLPIKTITRSDNDWNELTIDCDKDDCCLSYNCDLQIQIIGSVGYPKGSGIAAISSVTAAGSTLKSSHTLMAITSLVLALLVTKPLSR